MTRHRFFLSLLLSLISLPLAAQRATDIGVVDVRTAVSTVPVRVSASPEELDKLANFAFEAHGRYQRVTSDPVYNIRFTAVAGNRVQVDVTRGSTPTLSRTVTGSSLRHALLKAADVAVESTGGGKGFFASQLAFIAERTGRTEVYTGDLFFGGVRQLTSDGASAMSPRWSPDGSKILYTSFHRSNAADIFMIDLGTMQRNSFVSFKGTNQGARFSADGSKVAMVLSGEGNPEVYVANANGRGVTRRTKTSGVESSPVFSPDGRQLLFTSDAAGGPQLYVMPVTGGRMSRLPTNISRYCAEPDWSTGDPTKIAFTMRIGRGFQIGLFDLKTRAVAKQVSRAPEDAVEPVWLADGRHLLYTARAANSRSIWLLDTETGRSTRLSASSLGSVSQASVVLP
ncbi:biopolymer transporter Tol [Synoicihabitans lomoniglobus]|uniref:Biopolymer transporter Tol n=1 Tax=Synoicihabitans lomoniglobus TaxID=2909285 RepID=A0AAF0CM17_9BACT|nr:biopolymer transporter Tol [Opitutaceae bacterium LMO-M01]WED63498.1 biopolymer transporter Tol [Opitutaceae bacterium LMO-M01]